MSGKSLLCKGHTEKNIAKSCSLTSTLIHTALIWTHTSRFSHTQRYSYHIKQSSQQAIHQKVSTICSLFVRTANLMQKSAFCGKLGRAVVGGLIGGGCLVCVSVRQIA